MFLILGVEENNLKSVWDLLLQREISKRNIPLDVINKNSFTSPEMISFLVKRTPTSLTPYESVGK